MERIRHALSEESRLRADVVRTPTPSKMRQYLAAQESCVGLAEELREQLSLSASLSEALAARLRSWSSLVLPPMGDDDDQVWLDALRGGAWLEDAIRVCQALQAIGEPVSPGAANHSKSDQTDALNAEESNAAPSPSEDQATPRLLRTPTEDEELASREPGANTEVILPSGVGPTSVIPIKADTVSAQHRSRATTANEEESPTRDRAKTRSASPASSIQDETLLSRAVRETLESRLPKAGSVSPEAWNLKQATPSTGSTSTSSPTVSSESLQFEHPPKRTQTADTAGRGRDLAPATVSAVQDPHEDGETSISHESAVATTAKATMPNLATIQDDGIHATKAPSEVVELAKTRTLPPSHTDQGSTASVGSDASALPQHLAEMNPAEAVQKQTLDWLARRADLPLAYLSATWLRVSVQPLRRARWSWGEALCRPVAGARSRARPRSCWPRCRRGCGRASKRSKR